MSGLVVGKQEGICEFFLSHMGKWEFLQHALFWNTKDGGYLSLH